MGSLVYGTAIHIREQAKIDAARITQRSGNERRAAESNLQRFSAHLGNQRIMDAAGKNVNALTENIGRNLDSATLGSFSQRIAAAEELGANVAMAAAAGVGGSSIDAYNSTVRLSQAMAEEQQDRALNSDLINTSMQRGDILTDAVASMDNNVYAPSLDFTQYVDHQKQGLFGRLATLGVAAAATYFGGPQAGMAVINFNESQQAAKNGDFAAAGQHMMQSLDQGIKGAKVWRAGADNGRSGRAWGDRGSRRVAAGDNDIVVNRSSFLFPSFGARLQL